VLVVLLRGGFASSALKRSQEIAEIGPPWQDATTSAQGQPVRLFYRLAHQRLGDDFGSAEAINKFQPIGFSAQQRKSGREQEGAGESPSWSDKFWQDSD